MAPRDYSSNSHDAGSADGSSIPQQQQQQKGKKEQQEQSQPFECDYLVVGAGTSGMSFVDTVLTEDPTATFVVVDRNNAPGGHWVHVYPFCKLHQTSCNYGVNSMTLGKNINKKGIERYDIHDRSTGQEVVDYYQRVREYFESTGRVRCIFGVEYKAFDANKGVHVIQKKDDDGGGTTATAKLIEVRCHRKLVTVTSNVEVPAMRKPTIPVHENASFIPVNALPESIESGKYQNYIFFGCGKTGADAVVHLLRQGVDPSNVTWIVSRDAWYWMRETLEDFYKCSKDFMMEPVLKSKSVEDVFLAFEAKGLLARLDHPDGPTAMPRVFKGPVMKREEMELMKSVRNVVRLGRAVSVEDDTIVLEKGILPYTAGDTLLVDCMVDGFYGYKFSKTMAVFEPGRIYLGPLICLFNASLSAAYIAFLESALGEDDDDSKNGCCYFLRGFSSDEMTSPEAFIGSMYLQQKAFENLGKIKGGTKFLLTSRTSLAGPAHHEGGTLKFLWNIMGPNGLRKKGKQLVRKIESKGFADLDHCFGVETLGTTEIAL